MSTQVADSELKARHRDGGGRVRRPVGTEADRASSSQPVSGFGSKRELTSESLAFDAALGTHPLFCAQQAEKLADEMLLLSWMAHARLAIDAVAVAPADPLAR